jgi:hypothetical protein
LGWRNAARAIAAMRTSDEVEIVTAGTASDRDVVATRLHLARRAGHGDAHPRHTSDGTVGVAEGELRVDTDTVLTSLGICIDRSTGAKDTNHDDKNAHARIVVEGCKCV